MNKTDLAMKTYRDIMKVEKKKIQLNKKNCLKGMEKIKKKQSNWKRFEVDVKQYEIILKRELETKRKRIVRKKETKRFETQNKNISLGNHLGEKRIKATWTNSKYKNVVEEIVNWGRLLN